MIARGGSMRPFLPDGTPMLIIPWDDRPIAIGMIVLLDCPGGPLLHRIVGLRPGKVLTQGDGNTFPDPWVPLNAVTGVAILAIRKGKPLPLDGPGMAVLGRTLAFTMPRLRHLGQFLRP